MNEVNKLLNALGEDLQLTPDKQVFEKAYIAKFKKWYGGITPSEILIKSVKSAVETLVTMNESGEFYKIFPDGIETPKYGDKWGKNANYIEINNRAIAEMLDEKCRNGILSSIKILPAIPPSAKSWANCIILSQIFPNIYGDGYNKPADEENSIYGIKLNGGYSQNIISYDIIDKISAEEQYKAFNTLAHLHGLKTGFRTVISADQIKVVQPDGSDITFNWDNPEHEELFIKEHVKLINQGFEAIFVDSAKHIGGYEMHHYTGVGALPEYEQMQYITMEIRKRTGNTAISFIGEKSTGDFVRYKNLGLTTGTAFIEPDNYETVKYWSTQLKYEPEYLPGLEVSNDNDEGGRTYEQRLQKINSILFGYEYPSDKLPSFMQMEDIFPLRYDTNTHQLMMSNPSYSTDNTPQSHWENLFAKDDGRIYNAKVGELFIHALNL